MDNDALIIQKPDGAAAQLILLFHGYGSNAQDLVPTGRAMAQEFPKALVVSVNAPQPSRFADGFQWFGVDGITEEDRRERVNAAMPSFVECVVHWQQEAGVDAQGTALIGFSQGGIMALESTKLAQPPAQRVVSMAGRFATLPDPATFQGTVHFLHGKEDAVIAYQHTIAAAHHLRDSGVDITAEVLPFVGHTIAPEFVDLIVRKLSTHISHRVWSQAVQDVAPRQT
jgi:phospholipase/carboxylesterase